MDGYRYLIVEDVVIEVLICLNNDESFISV